MPEMVDMEKCIAALVMILGLCWPATVRAEVVLEAGEIDSSTVEVGALAVIVHMQEKPHPILRKWEQLVTTRGYVQSVHAEVLTLALERNGRLQRIAVDRIQRLTLMGVPSSETVEQNSAQVAVSRADGGFEGIAVPDGYQTLVVNGDTLVVQMAEPLPTGYQTIVVDGDTLTVQVLAEPLPKDEPLSAVIDDSLSAQKEAMESKGIKKKSKSRGASERLARFGFGVIGGTMIGTWTGTIVAKATKDCSTCRDDSLIGGGIGFMVGVIIGLGLAADPPDQAETPNTSDEARQISVGIVPNTKGRLSAVATLRF